MSIVWRVGLAASLVLAVPPAQAAELPLRNLEEAYTEGSTRVIVEFDTDVSPEGALQSRSAITAQRGRITSGGRRLASVLRGTESRVLRSFQTIPYAAIEADARGLQALARDSSIRAIEDDALAYARLHQSGPLIGAPVAHAAGHRGEGNAIVIIDTGIDGAHPSLAGRVVAEACFSARNNCPNGSSSQFGAGSAVPCGYSDKECRHGTHVAGIAAASSQGDPLPARDGIAPGAELIAIQVFSRFEGEICEGAPPCAASFTSDQIAALEYAYLLSDTFPIAAVNMSIGGNSQFTSSDACDAANGARKTIIDNLRSRNIATVAAAGNESFLQGLTSPACISSVIGVGATKLDDSVAAFSNSGPDLALLAPGQGIASTLPGGEWGAQTGTSMAAPHVAGSIALLRQKDPGSTVDAILSRLRSTGVEITDFRNGMVTPRVDLAAAIDSGDVSNQGFLEFPQDGRFASGISAFTGWVCDGQTVGIRVDGGPLRLAAYGTARDDTAPVCGDSDNGFALLHNFALDGPGVHLAELVVDGAVISTSTYTVATFGTSFISEAQEKSYVLENFEGRDVTVRWLQETQGFEIVAID